MAASKSSTTRTVHVKRADGTEYCRGTKDALIAAGICKPEWFPAAPVLWKGGRQKRSFDARDGDRYVFLYDRVRYWSVYILEGEEKERARREAEERRKEREADDLRRTITLATVTSDSVTEQQLEIVRLLWTVGDLSFASIVDFAEHLLIEDANDGQLVIEQAPRRRLELVVDNDRAPQ